MTNPFANNPDLQNTAVKGTLNNLGSLLGGLGNQQYAQFNAANSNLDAARQRQISALQNALAQKQNAFAGKQAQQDAGDSAAARMLGNSPLDFQNQRAEAARKQELWKGIDSGALAHLGVHAGPFRGGTNFATKFGPSPEAEQQWWETQNMLARGRAAKPNLGKIYGGANAAEIDDAVALEGSNRNQEWEGQWNEYQKGQDTGWAQLAELAAQDVASAKTEMEKATKTSWWQKLLGALGTLGPLAIAALSGGAAAPIAGAVASTAKSVDGKDA